MYGPVLRVPRLVAPVLVVLALAGYLSGSHTVRFAAARARGNGALVASAGNALLEYPPSWRSAGAAPQIPGLPISDQVVLAAGGGANRAGLVGGRITASEASPLPGSFRAILRGDPETYVVNLVDGQAYMYGNMDIPGYHRVLDLYVIPGEGNGDTALACYATQASSPYLSECKRIVAELTLTGPSANDLTPDGSYAGHLRTLIEGLDRARASLRSKMGVSTSTATLASLASRLAARFTATADALASLAPPPQPASAAQTELAGALVQSSAAYRALASAAGEDSEADSPAAHQQIDEAESSVDYSLESFALLGYGSPAGA
jgi:hypothetical protein